MKPGDRVEIGFTAPSAEDLRLNPGKYQTKAETGTIEAHHMDSDSRFQGAPRSFMVRVDIGPNGRLRVIPETELKVLNGSG